MPTRSPSSKVLEKIIESGDLPVMTSTIREITYLEKNTSSSAADLAQVILKDIALTTKVLQLANSVYYNWSQKEISTVSRAVVVLGFESVINLAVGVSVLDYFYRSSKSQYLRAHLFVTMFAAIFARALSEKLDFKNIEEIFILTLLNNIGLLLTAYALPEKFEEIRQLVITGEKGKNSAAKQILGTTFPELNVEIIRYWGFPNSIVSQLELIQLGSPSIVVSKDDILRSIVACATELFYSLHAREAFWYPRNTPQVMKKYFPPLGLTFEQGRALILKAIMEGKEFLDILQMEFSPGEFQSLMDEFIMEIPEDEQTASARPVRLQQSEMTKRERSQFLKNSLQDIDNSILENAPLNDILTIAMEGIQKGIGFDRVILFLTDQEKKRLQGRAGIGEPLPDPISELSIPISDSSQDHFSVAIRESKPLLVPSIKRPPYRKNVNWDAFNQLKSQSFYLLPLSFLEKTIGLFYVDRIKSKRAIDEKVLRLLHQYKTLIEASFQLKKTSNSAKGGK